MGTRRHLAVRLQELTRVGKVDKLKGYEIVKAVVLEPLQFSVEEELMTPSFKLRRPQLQVCTLGLYGVELALEDRSTRDCGNTSTQCVVPASPQATVQMNAAHLFVYVA